MALLAYVAVVGRPVARESLTELLWPEADPDDGRGALRRTLSVMRTALGGSWLQVDRRQVALDADGVAVDVAAFRQAAGNRGHAHGPEEACETCRRELADAVALYRGPFLEGFALRDSAAWDEWQSLEGEALRGELAETLRRLVALRRAEGLRAEAVAAGRRLLALDPLDEAGHRTLMRLHVEAGDRAAAVRQYRECVRVLEAELGVEPEDETLELYRSLVDSPRPLQPPGVGARADSPAGRDPGERPDARRPSEALDDAARAVLAAAAVLGDEIDPDLAAEVSGHGGGDATEAIGRLVSAGWLVEPDRARPNAGYRFADETDRARLLEELGLARRRQLHRRAATALQARSDGSSPDIVAARRTAEHYAAAGRPADAARLHQVAGDAARRMALHADATEAYRAALAAGAPDRPRLLARIGDAETLQGRYGEALAAYELGAALAEPGAVPAFEHRLGSLHLRRGALELADLHLAAAAARLGTAPSGPRARVLADRSLVAARRGDSATAGRLARASLRDARASDDAEAESQAENLLALLARRNGDLDGARRHLRRSLDRAAVVDDPGARVAALNNLALLERAAGNLDGALSLTDEALRRCVLLGDRHREAALRNNRADLLHALGRAAEAAEEQIRSVTAFADVGERGALEPEIWKLVEW